MVLRKQAMLAAALLAVATPGAALAQTTSNTGDPYAGTSEQSDDDGFPWGLLGLLGLAGLLGRKRNDDVRNDRTGNGSKRI
jgi:MYXO-CTERM domain-containing protein